MTTPNHPATGSESRWWARLRARKKPAKATKKATIHFDANGVCDACNFTERKRHGIDWADRERQLRELCDKHGALLIFDEIQTGVGRTGTFFAYEQEGITPDIVTLAKGLAGGVPIGAFLAKEEVAQAFHAGDHGSTFGGNPLACAAALAVMEAMEEEGLLDNANKLGQLLQDKLRQLAQKYPGVITTVRGRGLIVGAELAGQGRGIVEACLEKGVIINCTAGNVLRFVPPLNITAAHIEEVIAVLDGVLKEHGAF